MVHKRMNLSGATDLYTTIMHVIPSVFISHLCLNSDKVLYWWHLLQMWAVQNSKHTPINIAPAFCNGTPFPVRHWNTGKLRLSGARFCVLPSLLNTAMLNHQLKAKINDIVHIKYTIIWFHMVDKVTKIISKDALSQY